MVEMSDGTRAEVVRRAGERAREYFTQGRCCAEAVVAATVGVFGRGVDPSLLIASKGLCGGMGGHRATCGVFTGGALALSLLAGPEFPKDRLKAMTADFHSWLAEEAGGQICSELLERMGPSNFNHRLCGELTGRGAELTATLAWTCGRNDKPA